MESEQEGETESEQKHGDAEDDKTVTKKNGDKKDPQYVFLTQTELLLKCDSKVELQSFVTKYGTEQHYEWWQIPFPIICIF